MFVDGCRNTLDGALPERGNVVWNEDNSLFSIFAECQQ